MTITLFKQEKKRSVNGIAAAGPLRSQQAACEGVFECFCLFEFHDKSLLIVK